MAERAKLTPTDLVFVNAMAAAVMTWSLDDDWLALMLDAAREALPQVNREHPYLGPVADAADMMLIRAAGAGKLEERQALYRAGLNRAREALVRYFRWRAAEAQTARANAGAVA